MERYICIHGHFYQPPRENPWLETIELQDSAYPYHDWNERITAECYAPNAAARILNGNGKIQKIVNNYARISFNIGPTLLAWMEEAEPAVYQAILLADQQSRERFSGHGSALAQAYNHMILPLANRRDKETQIRWGIRDFEQRFGRKPEGMWLAETAVDLETLDLMAEQGIRFTILSPYQAARVRALGESTWRDVSGGRIDPSMPYRQQLPSGRSIAIFFYDGPISRAIAFEGLLRRGEDFVARLISGFSDQRAWPQLVHVATDGETYGHHHSHGDMALAYALELIDGRSDVRLTNYGEFLEQFPPRYEVEIYEQTAWSCAHGVERWRSHCGCSSGGYPLWNQHWRAPLRAALDWLRDRLAPLYEQLAGRYLVDPWAARNDYIDVMLNRSSARISAFLEQHALRQLAPHESVLLLKLLEVQRHAMLMYTSCGWFFDELSGLETVQVIHYAGRAVQLAYEVAGIDLESPFLERLALAKSNIPEHRDGRHIYEKWVKAARVDLPRVAAHYAISSLFHVTPTPTERIFRYRVEREDYRVLESGSLKLAVGHATITSEVTLEAEPYSFAVLHFGDHNLIAGVKSFLGAELHTHMGEELAQAFRQADIPGVIRLFDQYFDGKTYTLKSIFRDEQRKILRTILHQTISDTSEIYRHVYERYGPLIAFLREVEMPIPRGVQIAAEYAVAASLREALEAEHPHADQIAMLLDEARCVGVSHDEAGLGHMLDRRLEALLERLIVEPMNEALLQQINVLLTVIQALPFEVELWKDQNMVYLLVQKVYPEFAERAARGDTSARRWLEQFRSVGEKLGVQLPELQARAVG